MCRWIAPLMARFVTHLLNCSTLSKHLPRELEPKVQNLSKPYAKKNQMRKPNSNLKKDNVSNRKDNVLKIAKKITISDVSQTFR